MLSKEHLHQDYMMVSIMPRATNGCDTSKPRIPKIRLYIAKPYSIDPNAKIGLPSYIAGADTVTHHGEHETSNGDFTCLQALRKVGER